MIPPAVLTCCWSYAAEDKCECDDLTCGDIGFGEGELEAAALTGRAFSPDAAAVLLDNAAAKGQAEAGASECAGVGGVALLEAIEYILQFLLVDAAALVLDDETDFDFRRKAERPGAFASAAART